ncbi:MAG: undecaprenyldiphospho-muramoylpentapeptide beta-N-acetylglucosaminyltransferase [Prevotellaceae bacterium]|jgi:UDP-N-acetylglucosamine--N-acetylmuramyl-(pentapeptide) pyrophosphoryl-undecaprenol N-acetylglucosamine transferase|nr:undecaprenyldiphospho-muramoylpentapeptide beta-N-acetylglucosaminyltransferase [Prevotellaceae bacterium]
MKNKFIISGGGTGGHIFPAISIANELKKRCSDAEILFVGAEGRMEMEKVPAAGYKIEGLPVSGLNRKKLLKNINVLRNYFKSQRLAKSIVKHFGPDVVIGVGGYASAPTLNAAGKLNIPTVLQEQNSYAGVANKLLAKKAKKICVAYEGMERFFPKEKIVLTGNPVRQNLLATTPKAKEAFDFFRLDTDKKTILVVGGSLGARTVNQSIIAGLNKLDTSGIQFIWQTGKFYIEEARRSVEHLRHPDIIVTDFIAQMDYAYSVADLVISRAGAGAISELCLLGKACILVPSPNVAEDHQTQNALALVKKDAAIMITDAEAKNKLIDTALETIADDEKLNALSANISKMAQEDSAGRIVDEILNLI